MYAVRYMEVFLSMPRVGLTGCVVKFYGQSLVAVPRLVCQTAYQITARVLTWLVMPPVKVALASAVLSSGKGNSKGRGAEEVGSRELIPARLSVWRRC